MAEVSTPVRSRAAAWAARARRLAVNLSLAAVTIILMLVVLEGAIRWWGRSGPVLAVLDPVLGKRYVRNFTGRVYVAEAGREIELRFNREGFRGPDRPYEKPRNVRRVAIVGDSMTVAVATAEEKTMVVELERLMNRSHPLVEWEVMNFAVSSSSTGQELVLYREVVSRYQPDVVVLAFFVGNDLADNCRRLTSGKRIYFELADDGSLRQLPFHPSSRRVSAWLNRHSRLYTWWKEANDQVKARVRAAMGRTRAANQIFCTRETGDLAYAWELTHRLIARFRDEVESRGSRFVVAVFPYGPQIYDDLWQEIPEQAGACAGELDRHHPERRLGRICRAEGVPMVRMTDEFRAAARSRSACPEERLFYLGGREHWTDAGNQLAARVLHRFLVAGDPERSGPALVDQVLGDPGAGSPGHGTSMLR